MNGIGKEGGLEDAIVLGLDGGSLRENNEWKR